jgi:hypothetical protein
MGAEYETILPQTGSYVFTVTTSDIPDWAGATYSFEVEHKAECQTATITSWAVMIDEVPLVSQSGTTFTIPDLFDEAKLEVFPEFSLSEIKTPAEFTAYCGYSIQAQDLDTGNNGVNSGVFAQIENTDNNAAFTATIDHT